MWIKISVFWVFVVQSILYYAKYPTERFFRIVIFYFDKLKIPIKVSKEINSGVHVLTFLQKVVSIFFLIKFIPPEIVIYVIERIFRSWLKQNKLHKKVIKARLRKDEHTVLDKVFNCDLTEFQKGWSNIAVVGFMEDCTVNLL